MPALPALPTGTVTLLYSDIAGSTRLVRDLGERWGEVLGRQRASCREAWHRHHGHELGTEGDSFLVVFADAHDALAAAADVQRAMRVTTWPDGVALRLRVGVHTGTPRRHDEGYVGLDLHLGARVAAAAHGGQTVVSAATVAACRERPPGGSRFADRGDHTLKDIPEPVRLHELMIDEQASEPPFPALRTLGTSGSLPTLLTPTLGRDGELDELEALLTGGHRLVTLTGPGGSGKSRLATAAASRVASHFPDGVHFVPLAAVQAVEEVWPAVAGVLGLPPRSQSADAVLGHLAGRSLLLVLDNLEQVLGAETACRRLQGAHGVVVLATSRRALHVDGEREHHVPPLVLPPLRPGADQEAWLASARDSGAVQMFCAHARRARPGFALSDTNAEAVSRLCHALDGLPLALELVAARVRLLSPTALLARVDQSLDMTSADRSREGRQRTIRGTVAWSYDLLDPVHQAVLDRLGTFSGGAALEAVEAVTAAVVEPAGFDVLDVLYDLVDCHLVRAEDDATGEPRFSLLETVRRFALDRLVATDQWHEASAAHAQHYYDQLVSWWFRDHAGHDLTAFIGAEEGNLRAVVERDAVGVVDPRRYPGGAVPPGHAVALLVASARVARLFRTASGWSAAALAGPRAQAFDDVVLSALHFSIGTEHARTVDEALAEHHLRLAVTAARAARRGQVVGPGVAEPPWVSPASREAAALSRLVVLLVDVGRRADCDEPLEALRRLDEEEPLDRENPHDADRYRFAAYWVAEEDGDLVAAHDHLLAASRMRTVEDRVMHANNLADLELQLGELRSAQSRLAAAVRDLAPLVSRDSRVYCAETFAAVLASQHPEVCARVYAACGTERQALGLSNSSSELAEDDEVLGPVRALLGPERWEAAWARGRHERVLDLLLEMAASAPLPAP